MKKLSFYDVRTKKKFTTDKYKTKVILNKKTHVKMKFAIAKGPKGNDCWRVLGRA